MSQERSFSIVRVIARLNVGGPSTQAILMTEAFRKKGYRSLLVTGEVPAGEGSMEKLAHDRGIDVTKIPTLSRSLSPWNDLKSLAKLIAIFRLERPLLVHTHTAKAGALGRLAAILTRVPIRVHTFHGHTFHGYFSPVMTRVFLLIERWLARHSACIVAVSPSQRRELVEIYKVVPACKVVDRSAWFRSRALHLHSAATVEPGHCVRMHI